MTKKDNRIFTQEMIDKALSQINPIEFKRLMYGEFLDVNNHYLIFAKHPNHAQMYMRDNDLIQTRSEYNRFCKFVHSYQDIFGRNGYLVVWLPNFYFQDAEKRFGLANLSDMRIILNHNGNQWTKPSILEDLTEYIKDREEFERQEQLRIKRSKSKFWRYD